MILTQLNDPPETSNQPVPTLDDLALVQRAKKDISQFSALYDRYATQVYRYLLVRVGNEQDAQDLTSQTFMAAMKGLSSFKGQSPFPAWLLGIARNKAADLFRQRRPVSDLDDAMETADSGDDMDEIVDRHMAIEKVARKLQTISPDRAEALSLRLFGGLEVGEIARIMDRQEPAVRMLVFRGLRDLQAQLNVTQETM
jgi:RNA polymerase sigma-70 factor (ECF subfamily)